MFENLKKYIYSFTAKKGAKRLKTDEIKLESAKIGNVADCFEILPDELILHIFGFLINYDTLLSYCPQVCKRWKRLSYDVSLWRNVCLKDKKIHIKKLQYLVNFGIRRLKIDSCIISGIEFTYFQLIKNYFKFPNTIRNIQHSNLQYIFLFNNNMSIDSLIYVLSNCFDLKEIHICIQEINDIVCQYIARNESLTTLDLSCPRGGFSVSGISKIFKKCKYISNVKVFNQHFSEEDFTHVLDGVNSLPIKSMEIIGRNVSDIHIKKMTECCPNLVELNLRYFDYLTSSSVKYIVEGFPKLQRLSLDCSAFIPPEIFLQLRCLRSLSYLEIFIGLYDTEPNFPNEIKKKLEDASIHVNIRKWW